MPSPTTALPAPLRRLVVELRWRRRSIAGALAVLAILVALDPVRSAEPRSVEVLVATRALDAGRLIGSADVRAVRRPAAAVPDGALRSPPLGRVVALPVLRGEILTDVRVLGGGLLAALGPDTVAAPVHLADAATAGLVRVGDLVDVLAAGEAGTSTVATSVRVLLAAAPGSGNALRDRAPDAVVVLAVPRTSATALAGAGASARLSIVLRSASTP